MVRREKTGGYWKWTLTEAGLAYLREHTDKSIQSISRALGVDSSVVLRLMAENNIVRTIPKIGDGRWVELMPGVSQTGFQHVLTDEGREELTRRYPIESMERIAKDFGITESTLYAMAKSMGLEKDEDYTRSWKEKRNANFQKRGITKEARAKAVQTRHSNRLREYARESLGLPRLSKRRLGPYIDAKKNRAVCERRYYLERKGYRVDKFSIYLTESSRGLKEETIKKTKNLGFIFRDEPIKWRNKYEGQGQGADGAA